MVVVFLRCLSWRLSTKSSWGFLCAPRKTNGNASVQEECHPDLASPRPLHPSGALDEVAMVVAAMHSAVLVAEKSDVVSTTERTLNPTRMDHPGRAYTCACDWNWTTAVSTATGMCCGASFDEAPLLLAAAHSSDTIAEVASVVDLAEGAAPRVKCRRLKRSGIVPTCDGWLWVLSFTLVGHGEEWADFVVACGLVRVDTGILLGSRFRQLSSIAIALGHLVVAVAAPATATIVDGAPTAPEAPSAPAAAHPPTRRRRLQRCGVQGFLLPALDLRLGVLRLGLIGHLQVGTFVALLSVALALGHLVVAVAVPATTTVVDGAPTAPEAPGAPAAAHPCEAPAEIADMVGSAELHPPARGRRLQRCGVQGFFLPTLELPH